MTLPNLKALGMVNRSAIVGDRLLSFDRQLLELSDNIIDCSSPMIVSHCSDCIDYVDVIDSEAPLVMNISTVLKIKSRHDLNLCSIADSEGLLKSSVLAFESITEPTSVIFLTDKFKHGDPVVIICRYGKPVHQLRVNEITSIYGRPRLQNLLTRTWDSGKRFWVNQNTRLYFLDSQLTLPAELKRELLKKQSVCREVQHSNINLI